MIIVIHENNEWILPFAEAFNKLDLEYDFWYLPDMGLDLTKVPPEAVYWNRMSASSHTRGHRYEPELTAGILSWLKRHGRAVVNGPKALDLEISKIRQYQELESFGIRVPKTFCTLRETDLLHAANDIGFPLITKHNRAGKGLGVRKFDTYNSLENYVTSDSFESSPDGITLLQQYIESPSQSITRMEFVNSKFFYAVRVDTSDGFELCPAEACKLDSNCPTVQQNKFVIENDFRLDDLNQFEKFLMHNDIGIAGIEIIYDTDGEAWAYDVNTNTNYNPQAEAAASLSAPRKIATYLSSIEI